MLVYLINALNYRAYQPGLILWPSLSEIMHSIPDAVVMLRQHSGSSCTVYSLVSCENLLTLMNISSAVGVSMSGSGCYGEYPLVTCYTSLLASVKKVDP